MENEIKTMLNEEIEREIQGLDSMSPGSDEHTKAVENLSKLYKLRLEEIKNDRDYEEKCERRSMEKEQREIDKELKQIPIDNEVEFRDREEQLKRDQLTEQIKDRYFRIAIEVVGIVLPLAFYASWMRKGFKFEETGTFTSTTFRGLFNRFKPTKK